MTDKCKNPDCDNGKSYLGTNEQGFVVYPKTGKHYSIPCPECQPENPPLFRNKFPTVDKPDHIPDVRKKVKPMEFVAECENLSTEGVYTYAEKLQQACEIIKDLNEEKKRLEEIVNQYSKS